MASNFEQIKQMTKEEFAVFLAVTISPNDYWREGEVKYYLDYLDNENNVLDSVKTLMKESMDLKGKADGINEKTSN